MERNRRRLTGSDALLCLLILILSVGHIYRWPRDLFKMDEGLFLYEAKRILDGDVPYRDFFEIIGPGSHYAIAFAFWAFGVDMATARMTMAVLHGLIAITIYVTCRSLGVRREFSMLAALAHVTVGFPPLAIASAHWFSSFLAVLLLLAFVRRPWVRAPTWVLLPGVLTGLMLSVQQQKGAVFAAGGCLVLCLEWLIDRRAQRPSPPLVRVLALFSAGTLLAAFVVLLPALAQGGIRPMYEALVEFPLLHYHGDPTRGFNRAWWGQYAYFLPHPIAFPRLFRYQHIVLVVPIVRGIWSGFRHDTERLRLSTVLVAFGGLSILSIAYNPDYVHLALISSVFFIVGADAGEWLLDWRGRAGTIINELALAASVVVLLGYTVQMARNIEYRTSRSPFVHQTAFGRVNFRNPDEITVINTVRRLMENRQSRELFCYQSCASLYLTTATTNPTPYQQLIPHYNPPEHIEETIALLEHQQVAYIVVAVSPFMRWKEDPVVRYVHGGGFHRRPLPFKGAGLREFALFERNS